MAAVAAPTAALSTAHMAEAAQSVQKVRAAIEALPSTLIQTDLGSDVRIHADPYGRPFSPTEFTYMNFLRRTLGAAGYKAETPSSGMTGLDSYELQIWTHPYIEPVYQCVIPVAVVDAKEEKKEKKRSSYSKQKRNRRRRAAEAAAELEKKWECVVEKVTANGKEVEQKVVTVYAMKSKNRHFEICIVLGIDPIPFSTARFSCDRRRYVQSTRCADFTHILDLDSGIYLCETKQGATAWHYKVHVPRAALDALLI